jgi:hypothetical protein
MKQHPSRGSMAICGTMETPVPATMARMVANWPDHSDSLVYFPEDREAGFVLLCTGKPRSALRIRAHQQAQMRQHRKQKGLLAPFSWSPG